LGKVILKNKRIATKERLHTYMQASKARVKAMIGAGDIGEMVEPIKEKLSCA
jgi:hypothetical protein